MAPRASTDRAFPLSWPSRTPRAPQGENWLHEVKRDGYRLTAIVRAGRVRLRWRQDVDWTDRLPSIVAQVEALGLDDGQIDGELIAVDADGRDDFNLLQQTLIGRARAPLQLIAFDLLSLSRRDLRHVPLLERKAALEELLRASPVLFSTHLQGRGPEVFDAIARQGCEGIVSKRVGSAYEAGPTRTWLKTMARLEDDFVAIGWRAARKDRRGGLLVAKRTGTSLRYAGCVSSGFARADLAALRSLPQLGVTSSFEPNHTGRPASLASLAGPLVRIAFRGLTVDGLLRHAAYRGIRLDGPRP